MPAPSNSAAAATSFRAGWQRERGRAEAHLRGRGDEATPGERHRVLRFDRELAKCAEVVEPQAVGAHRRGTPGERRDEARVADGNRDTEGAPVERPPLEGAVADRPHQGRVM
jgi:hypothetical protein